MNIYETAIKTLSIEFNNFIAECMDEHGNIKLPTRQAIMKARGMLPPYCEKALSKKNK